MSDVTEREAQQKNLKLVRLMRERQHLRELARAATDPDSTKKATKRALDQLVRDALEET